MADEPVSRILCGVGPCGLAPDDHSSSPGLATGIERPTRGFILDGWLAPPRTRERFVWKKHSV